jgi:trypsin-like peptidase
MKFRFIIVVIFLTQSLLYSQTKIEAFEKNKDAVVRIYSMGLPGAGNSYYYSTGSGFTVNDEGWIFTNHHVVEDAVGYYVVGYTDTKPDTSIAYVIWKDKELDIAILKTDDLKLPSLKLKKSDNINQGDEILILGFPGSRLNDHEIKVTSGILSSSTKDSTLMTTAPINPGNSGGPAINYAGEVVGQVYAKLVGLNVESTGFLRNIKYLEDAIVKAKDKEIPMKKSIGIDNYNAYKEMCFADAEYIKIHETKDSTEKMKYVDNAIQKIKKVLDMEPDYALARYYLVNYLFKKAELHCEFDNELDEIKADKIIEEFQYHWAKAKKDSRDEEYADEINASIENKIYSLADADDIACYRWRDRVSSYSDFAYAREVRNEELQDYIHYGTTPKHLRETLINPTWERAKYKKYDAFVNEIPLAVTLNNYLSFDGIFSDNEITSTISELEFEIEPINELKVLLNIGFAAKQIKTPEQKIREVQEGNIDALNDYRSAETIPIKIGFYAYSVRARYNITDSYNVLTRKWSLEYMSTMPGDQHGDKNSYSYVGIGQYVNDFDTDYAINIGQAFEIFDSRVWLDIQLVLGFGDIPDLYQLGIGLGYRY